MKFGFYGPECVGDKASAFCCMTNGFPDTEINTTEQRSFPADVEGESLYGSYAACLQLAERIGGSAKAVIVYTNNKGGENEFMKKLSALVSCPIVGGGAAIGGNPDVLSLPDNSAEAGICLITDRRVRTEAVFENIHSHILEECDLEFTDCRVLDKINGEPAAEYLRRKKAEHGFSENDFEHMTLSTMENINAHMNRNDGVNIRSGRDLQKKMLLRYVEPQEVQGRMERFYNEPGAAVFGCAGLRGIMESSFACCGFGGFLFGEICTVNGHGDFGNLMLSKLRLTIEE